MPMSSKWYLHSQVLQLKFVCSSRIFHARYGIIQSHPFPFHHTYNIWWREQIIKFLQPAFADHTVFQTTSVPTISPVITTHVVITSQAVLCYVMYWRSQFKTRVLRQAVPLIFSRFSLVVSCKCWESTWKEIIAFSHVFSTTTFAKQTV
jgi:hypothetical protein